MRCSGCGIPNGRRCTTNSAGRSWFAVDNPAPPATGDPEMTGSALLVAGREITVNADGCAVDDLSFCGAVTVTVPADTPWTAFVDTAVDQEWVGVEALAGLTGTVGEVVAGGSAAYGQHVADVVATVRTWDEVEDRQRTFAAADCEFDIGSSRFATTDRYAILDVAFLMRQGDLTLPIRDAELGALLGVEPGARAPLDRVRGATRAQGAGAVQ